MKHDERCWTRCPSFRRRRVEARGEGEETILANRYEISTACFPVSTLAIPPSTVADGMVLADPTEVDIKSCRRRLRIYHHSRVGHVSLCLNSSLIAVQTEAIG